MLRRCNISLQPDKVVLQTMMSTFNFNAIAKEAENNFLDLKKNVQKLLREYESVVNDYDKLKLQLAELRAQIDKMGEE